MGPQPAVAAVRLAVRRSLADLDPGQGVLVACSGGADSLALAAATAFETRAAGARVVRAGAVTVDHGLQPDSASRAEAVADILRDLGLDPVVVVAVHVGREGGPEAAARTARYAALDATADRLDAAAVLLGHTRDDQAETVLLGLARGSGARSLAGMAPVAGRYRRPLLDLSRATLRAACAAEGLPVWDDPHNLDPTYARVRVRTSALPALEAALGAAGGESVGKALSRTARLLRDDADALDDWARSAAARCMQLEPDVPGLAGVRVALPVEALAELPAAVRRRVLRLATLESGAPAGDLAAGHVDALEELVTSWRGQGPLELPGGLRALRRCGRLLLLAAARSGGADVHERGKDRE